jgi:hypothetical protein
LEAPAGDQVGRARVLDHIERVLVSHVDNRCADLNATGLRADGGQEWERRRELAGEVVNAEIRPIRAPRPSRNRQIDGLQERGCDCGEGVVMQMSCLPWAPLRT